VRNSDQIKEDKMDMINSMHGDEKYLKKFSVKMYKEEITFEIVA
jgi:hypothetical protein